MKNAYINEEGVLVEVEDVNAFNKVKNESVFCLCGLATPCEQILQSNAGYYIGTAYYDEEVGAWLPNTRDSWGYYVTMDEAINALKTSEYMYR